MSNNDDINKKRNSNDEDAEYGMSVSATELNQLRQHVIAMRRQKATELLEEVDIGRTNNNNNNNNGNGNGNGNGNQKEGLITATTETNYSKRLFRLAIMSNMLFVFGAILYVCVAHGDLQWAKSIKGIPISVLEADDDAAWNSFLDKSTSINNDYGRDGNSRTGRVAAGGDAGNRLLQQQQQQGTDINDTLWVNLPTDIQLALMVLGHNQESWDSEATSSIEELPWAQLTDAQKNAAMIVGYNEQSWNAAEEEEAALANINDTVWVNLPPDIQLALMVLGHNQNSWDSEATSSVEELPWGQLTTEQKDAARIIGYNRLSWNAAKQEEQQQQETNIIDDTLWVDLPPDIQLALMVLGHNQNSWDNEATSSVEELPWSQLTAQQKNAAMIMGFDEQSWNAAKEEAFLEQSDTNAPTDDQYYDDQYYDDQAPVGAGGGGAFYDDQYDPLDETSAWQYNDDADADAITPTEAFDEVDNSPTDDYFMAQENAVTTTSSTAPPTTTSTTKPPQDTTKAPATDIKEPELTAYGNTLPTFENVKSLDDLMVWNGFTWEELPNEIQAHFEILGYNEERWDTGGTAFTENLYWDELTQPQQQAAKALGYNQYWWDYAEEGNYDVVTGNSDESLPNAKAVATDQSRGGSASTTMTTDQDSTSIKPTKNNAGYAEIGEEYANHGYQYRDVDIDDEQDDIVADQVMLFFAAASFMAVGVMNFFRERQVFHIWMVQGGVFGILAALCMQASSFATLMLQTVSVHCFLIEAIFMLRARRTKDANNGMQFAGWTADILFAMGAVMHVIMVYWQHGDDKAYASVRLAKTGVVSAWLWLICAGIQSYCTIVALAQRMEEQTIINQHHHSESLHPNGERYTIKPAAIQRRRMQQQNKNSDHDDEESIYPSQEDFVIS